MLLALGSLECKHKSFCDIFQIYVEIERARLTRMLAQIKEEQGDITGKEAGALICYF